MYGPTLQSVHSHYESAMLFIVRLFCLLSDVSSQGCNSVTSRPSKMSILSYCNGVAVANDILPSGRLNDVLVARDV